jgi:hypothetical protein
MSTDLEHDLRSQMAQAPIRPRLDVVREAFRRSRRRQRASRATLAAGVAAVAGVAATVAVSGQGQPHRQGIETTAYVVRRVDSALAAVDDDMMQIHGEVSYAYQGNQNTLRIDTWSYRNQSHDLWFFNGVESDASHSYTATNGTPDWEDTSVSVDYRSRVATKATAVSPQPRTVMTTSCSEHGFGNLEIAPAPGELGNAAAVAAAMRALLSCGNLSVSWHQHYQGTEAIKIVSHAPLAIPTPKPDKVTQVLWVNEATFLPIAVTTLGGTTSQGTAATQYAWLPPTKANLANLTVAIPSGFTVVTSKSAPSTGLTLPYAEIPWLFALAG